MNMTQHSKFCHEYKCSCFTACHCSLDHLTAAKTKKLLEIISKQRSKTIFKQKHTYKRNMNHFEEIQKIYDRCTQKLQIQNDDLRQHIKITKNGSSNSRYMYLLIIEDLKLQIRELKLQKGDCAIIDFKDFKDSDSSRSSLEEKHERETEQGNKIEQLEAEKAEIEKQFKDQVEQYEIKIGKYKSEMEAQTEQRQKSDDECKKLKSELHQLQMTIDQLKNDQCNNNKQLQVSKQMELLLSNHEIAIQQDAKWKEKINQMNLEVQNYQKQLQQHQEDYIEQQKQNDKLLKQIRSLQSLQQQLEQKIVDTERAQQEQSKRLQQVNVLLSQTQAELENAQFEIDRLSSTNAQLSNENDHLAKTVEGLRKNISKSTTQSIHRSAKSDQSTCLKHNEKLKNDLQQIQYSLNNKQLEIDSLQEQLSQKKDKIQQLESQYAKLEHAHDTDANELADNKSKIMSLQHQIDVLQNEIQQNQGQLSKMRQKITLASNECEEAKSLCAEKESLLENANDELLRLKAQLQTNDIIIEQFHQTKLQLQKQLKQQKEENERITNDLFFTNEKHAQLLDSFNKLQLDYDTLTQDFENAVYEQRKNVIETENLHQNEETVTFTETVINTKNGAKEGNNSDFQLQQQLSYLQREIEQKDKLLDQLLNDQQTKCLQIEETKTSMVTEEKIHYSSIKGSKVMADKQIEALKAVWAIKTQIIAAKTILEDTLTSSIQTDFQYSSSNDPIQQLIVLANDIVRDVGDIINGIYTLKDEEENGANSAEIIFLKQQLDDMGQKYNQQFILAQNLYISLFRLIVENESLEYMVQQSQYKNH